MSARVATPFAALEPLVAAIEDGAGLPEVVRRAARLLNASLVVIDRASGVLAVAARSPSDERALMERARDVQSAELRAAGRRIGELRVRPREEALDAALLGVVRALLAAEVERVRAPERAAAEAGASFVRAVLRREVTDRGDIVARGNELGCDLANGGSVVVVRAHALAPAEEDWRRRLLGVVERTARSAAVGALVALAHREDGHAGEALVLVPGGDDAAGRRLAEALPGELEAGLPGFGFAVGRSRVALDPADLHRAGREARLAANVAEADAERAVLAFDDTGAYRLLLSEDPAELGRFFAETIEPLVLYDDQYETELVRTLETFLDLDGNVAGSAQRLFTHRHTIRYRLERVRELTGLDVGSTDGRERLGLGLKAMRVLGIGAPIRRAGE